MSSLDNCVHCGESARLQISEVENMEPVTLPNDRLICGRCYNSLSAKEYARYFE